MSDANWYVVHTYSGYENKVKANIEKTIENRHLEDQILEVRVPMQEVVEVKNGAKKQVLKKLFPGYVLLNMIMNDEEIPEVLPALLDLDPSQFRLQRRKWHRSESNLQNLRLISKKAIRLPSPQVYGKIP